MRRLLILPRSTESGTSVEERYELLSDERHRRHVENLIDDLLAVEASRRLRHPGDELKTGSAAAPTTSGKE